jgi:ABC-type anion transport system duplicated permease subunit
VSYATEAVQKPLSQLLQLCSSQLTYTASAITAVLLLLLLLLLVLSRLSQVQRLKLDTEAAMLELDQILRANELSISLVAAVPALLLSWTLLRGLWQLLLVRSPPDARREATPAR